MVIADVESYGPRIDPDERTRVFLPGVRGRHAVKTSAVGSGIGLWQARLAMKDWGSIEISQDDRVSRSHPNYYRTTMTLSFMNRDVNTTLPNSR